MAKHSFRNVPKYKDQELQNAKKAVLEIKSGHMSEGKVNQVIRYLDIYRDQGLQLLGITEVEVLTWAYEYRSEFDNATPIGLLPDQERHTAYLNLLNSVTAA